MTKIMRQRSSRDVEVEGSTLQVVICNLTALQEKHGENSRCEYAGGGYLYVTYEELETDEEYADRVNRINGDKMRRLAQYENLKKEFG